MYATLVEWLHPPQYASNAPRPSSGRAPQIAQLDNMDQVCTILCLYICVLYMSSGTACNYSMYVYVYVYMYVCIYVCMCV